MYTLMPLGIPITLNGVMRAHLEIVIVGFWNHPSKRGCDAPAFGEA
jgi:hypothetical protein